METRRVALRVFLDSIGLLSILHIGTPTMQDRLNGKQRDLFRFIYPPPFFKRGHISNNTVRLREGEEDREDGYQQVGQLYSLECLSLIKSRQAKGLGMEGSSEYQMSCFSIIGSKSIGFMRFVLSYIELNI